jgi:hypothetical protein
MFANFPGFLYLKGAGRQLTNQFRVAPGSGIGLDASVDDIRQAVMPLPYKSPDAAFTAFVQHVEELGQRLGGTANTAVAEGRADAPVGTTLALIEQASKPVGAVNRRLHASQAREFKLLKDRFREDPEAFWRFNKSPAMAWEKEQFLKALEDYNLAPVSDPNNPTKLHRMAKAEAYRQVVMGAPEAFDPKKAILKYTDELGIPGVEETLSPAIGQPPPAQPPDPAKMADVQHKQQKAAMDAANAAQDRQADMIIPADEIPASMDYQLVTVAVYGDWTMGQLSDFEKNGWRRVPNERHPSIRSDDPVWLEKGGLALVERPKYLTVRAQKFERAKADAQLLAAIGGFHETAEAVGRAMRGPVEAIVNRHTHPRSTQRELDPRAPKKAAKRKRNLREFATLHTWRFRNWLGNKWAGGHERASRR